MSASYPGHWGRKNILRNPIATRRQTVTEILDKAYANGGGTVLVDGMFGMGTTHFLRQFSVAAKEPPAWNVTHVSADYIERGEPYSFIERLLLSGIANDWDFQPDDDHQPIEVARECVRLILNGCEGAGRIIIIDDTQWIDPKSVRVLRHMIPRVHRRNVLMVFGAITPHPPGSLGELLAMAAPTHPEDHHITLEPLTEDEILALAIDRFGVTISRRNATKLRELTGGSFLGVESIFDQVTAEEISQLHTTWDMPIRNVDLENPLLSSYQELSPGAQQVMQIVSLAAHEISSDTLCTAAERLGVPDKSDEAIRAGVIMESGFGRYIVPKHTLIASAVRDVADPAFAQEVHQVLAGLTEGYRSIRHRFKGAKDWNADLKQCLEAYIPGAIELGQISNASEILRMALELADDPADRQQLIIQLVLLNLRAKRGYLCLDLLREIETFPPSMLREFLVLMLRVYLVNETYPWRRLHAVLQVPSSTPDEAALQAHLTFMLALMTIRSPNRRKMQDRIDEAKIRFAEGPQHPDELSDARLGWIVTPQERILLLDCYEVVDWHLNGEIQATREVLPARLERASSLPDIPIKIDCLAPLANAAMSTGNILLAHDIATEAVELFDRVDGEPWAGGTPYVILAHTSLLLGRYDQAKRALDDLEKISHETLELEARLTGAALHASLLAITTQEDPSTYISLAARLKELRWELYGRDLRIMAKAEIARVQQDAEALEQITSTPGIETISNTQRGFLTHRAHALISLDRTADAEELISELAARRGISWFEYCGTLEWLQARLAQANGETNVAQDMYKFALEERNYPLPWALTALDYGMFLQTTGHPDQAVTVFQEAVATLQEIGAEAYLPAARQQLDGAREHNQSVRASALAALTEREREVARLLAEGRSNREISESLYVSMATARFHVSNILRKLELSSRAEVGPLLRNASASQSATEATSRH
ncbi:helix-turn-helix transcriptional regulator [Yaniella halotolerans]|uniref:helix-turn-helix transcriptional regulator n=1 Tax=Yaniella halotolerans TaxID=225453 RepID=UPI0012EB53B4|nr:LuxR C-terminal-related transcriptional regulator [Yaniella halotolerans]